MTEVAFIKNGKFLSTSNHLSMSSSESFYGTVAHFSHDTCHLRECSGTFCNAILHHINLSDPQSLSEPVKYTMATQNRKRVVKIKTIKKLLNAL